MKAKYLISCAFAAIAAGAAGSAIAADDTSTSTAASDASTSAAVGEIMVTAERRSEDVQQVPMTLQAFSQVTLQQQHVETVEDLIKYTPNITYGSNGPGQGVIFMRGLSAGLQGNQSSATIATFPNVALYLDDQ